MCWNSPVPPSYVVTANPNSTACPGVRTLTVPPVNAGVHIYACAPSTIPVGYVITEHAQLPNCASKTGWRLTVPPKNSGQKVVVCANSPIPSGYVKKWTVTTSSCGNGLQNAFELQKL